MSCGPHSAAVRSDVENQYGIHFLRSLLVQALDPWPQAWAAPRESVGKAFSGSSIETRRFFCPVPKSGALGGGLGGEKTPK